MKTKIFLFLWFLNGSLALADADFSKYWDKVRSQQDLGLCHIFAATALVEAEWAAQYKEHVDFSEAFTSIKHIFGPTEEVASTTFGNLIHSQAPLGATIIQMREGGRIQTSFDLIKQFGVVPEKEVSYRKFRDFMKELKWRLGFEKEDKKNGSFYTGSEKKLLAWNAKPGKHSEWLSDITFVQNDVENNLVAFREIKEKLACRPVAVEVSAQVWGRSGAHAIVLVSFEKKNKRFKVRNSWGRAGLLNAYEYIEESLIRDNVLTFSYLRNPAIDCF